MMGRRLAALAIALLLLASAVPAAGDTIELPGPQSDQLSGTELFQALGISRDQLPGYLAPGAIVNDELVDVQVSGDGTTRQVTDRQRIELTGTGDYFLRESGPAVRAVAVGADPPLLSLGDVIWQGFSTGRRQLAADFELDPAIEFHHLPLRISLSFAGADGRQLTLGRAGLVPGPGTVTLTVSNATGQPTRLPTARDVAAQPVAAALDQLRADTVTGARLATNRTGLPTELAVTGATTRPAYQLMPLRLSGTLRLTGTEPTVAGGEPSAVGADPTALRLAGLLTSRSRFTFAVRAAGRLSLDLTAVPALDPGSLSPPGGHSSWSAWAAAGPAIQQRQAALDVLVRAAAAGSRASAYSPYLGGAFGAQGSTRFHYTLAPPDSSAVAQPALHPRPVPIGLAALAVLALLSLAAVVWRRC